MAIPYSRPAFTPSGISCQGALFMETAIFALTSIQDASSLPIQQPPFIPTDQAIPTKIDVTNNVALDTMKQKQPCFVNPSDLTFSDSLGDEPEYCNRGTRMSSVANPCPDGDLCCACEPGSFQPGDNVCDTCWNHTKCDTYKSHGNAFTDSICMDAPRSGDNQDVTTDLSLTHPPDPGTEPGDSSPSLCKLESPCLNDGTCAELIDTSLKCFCPDGWEGEFCQADKNECLYGDVCKNGGTCNNLMGSFDCSCPSNWKGRTCEVEGSSKFSIEHPYSAIMMVAVPVMLMVIIAMIILIFFIIRHIRRRSGTYTVSPMQDSSQELTHLQGSNSNSDEESKLQEEI